MGKKGKNGRIIPKQGRFRTARNEWCSCESVPAVSCFTSEQRDLDPRYPREITVRTYCATDYDLWVVPFVFLLVGRRSVWDTYFKSHNADAALTAATSFYGNLAMGSKLPVVQHKGQTFRNTCFGAEVEESRDTRRLCASRQNTLNTRAFKDDYFWKRSGSNGTHVSNDKWCHGREFSSSVTLLRRRRMDYCRSATQNCHQ